MARTGIERANAQAGTVDEAGTPRLAALLVALLGGAAAWTFHLLGSYVLLAYACATGMAGSRIAIASISLVALLATAGAGWLALRQWRISREVDRPVDDAWDARMGERSARISFLMVVGLVLAVIFAIGIVYEGMAVFFAPLCEAGGGT